MLFQGAANSSCSFSQRNNIEMGEGVEQIGCSTQISWILDKCLNSFVHDCPFYLSWIWNMQLLFVCLFQAWEAAPWMTSWSTPVIHIGKQIPLSTNQLIEKYYGMSVG